MSQSVLCFGRGHGLIGPESDDSFLDSVWQCKALARQSLVAGAQDDVEVEKYKANPGVRLRTALLLEKLFSGSVVEMADPAGPWCPCHARIRAPDCGHSPGTRL